MSLSKSKISEEQQEIINKLKDNNVIVDAVAGSGKTTTVLHIANDYLKNNKDFKILLLTYNSRLKIETIKKANDNKLTNIDVFTYHSFCCHHYYKECYTDINIEYDILNPNICLFKDIDYDLFILDEAQDMTFLLFKLFKKIYRDNKIKNNIYPKICILGDKKQSIYQYNSADERYITLADNIFNNLNEYKWEKCKLSESFRITYEMSKFLNKCVLKENRIISNKKSDIKPRYVICHTFTGYDIFMQEKVEDVYKEIMYYLDLKDNEGNPLYNYDDILILAPSITSKGKPSPVVSLENHIKKLSKNNIFIYVPLNDEDKIDEDVIKNKMVICTFHQSKGIENKVVIVFNFDEAYFNFYGTDIKNKNECPNIFYVALTRAKERLSVLHHCKNNYLPFLKREKLEKYCDVIIMPKRELNIKSVKSKEVIKEPEITPISVTELLKNCNNSLIKEYHNILIKKEIKDFNKEDNKHLTINYIIKTYKNKCENVSELLGIAIPSLYEYNITNKCKIYDEITDYIHSKDIKKNKPIRHLEYFKGLDINNKKISDFIFYANFYNSYVCNNKNYIYKIYQIHTSNYDYILNDNQINKILKRLEGLEITENSEFEKYEKTNITINENKNYLLHGFIDCYDQEKDIVYEFKCCKSLTDNHFRQALLYKYITGKKTILYNIITNQCYEIDYKSREEMKKLIIKTLKYKYENIYKSIIDDEEFIKINNII